MPCRCPDAHVSHATATKTRVIPHVQRAVIATEQIVDESDARNEASFTDDQARI